jgi:hypothetical protein
MNNLFKCGEYNINMTIQHGFINTLSPYSTMSNRFSKRNVIRRLRVHVMPLLNNHRIIEPYKRYNYKRRKRNDKVTNNFTYYQS